MLRSKAILTSTILHPLILRLLHSAPAFAENPHQLIEKGISLREEGRDEEALALFEQAYAAEKSGNALTQIALAEQALGRWVEAEAHLLEALAMKDPWIEKRRKPLEGALETIRKRLANLEVIGTPEGAVVNLNGKEVGTIPPERPVRVLAGTIVIDVVKEGYRPLSRTIEVSSGSLARERFDLVKELAIAPPPPPSTPMEPPPPPPPTAPATRVTITAESGGPDLFVWGIVAASAGAVGIGVGAVGAAIRNSNVNKYNDDARCLINGLPREVNCKEELDASYTGEAMAIGGFVAGGALIATSILLRRPRPRNSPPEAAVHRSNRRATSFA